MVDGEKTRAKILVIEDESDVRENILEILAHTGFDVLEAANGSVGVQLARQHFPDLIVCDIMMPELDGYGVLQALQADPSTAMIPFIFLTARADRGSTRQGMELGADDYLSKPFFPDELLATVHMRLAKREAMVRAYKEQAGDRFQVDGFAARSKTSPDDTQVAPEQLNENAMRNYQRWVKIGEGSAGTIFRAYQPAIGRDVAIKVLKTKYADNPEFILRFETEAALVARLEHPHIVPLYDFWHDQAGIYLVMRWLRGGSLRESLEQQGAWSVARTAQLLDQIADALAVAHSNGIIHRDLKPGNILLDERGNAYLTDFGLAKPLIGPPDFSPPEHPADDSHILQSDIYEDASSTLYITDTDSLVGTPAYLSPEQIRGEALNLQTDIYSLGITLYEMLAGKHPYADELSDIVAKHLQEPVPSIHKQRPEIPQSIDVVIQEATAKDWRKRYKDVPAMAAAFRRAFA